MILKKIWTPSFQFLLHRNINTIISHKFYYGQGGDLHLDLRRRTYSISIETIWEDYSLLQIEGLTGIQNFTLYEQDGISYFQDSELQMKESEHITATLKIPEDYTMRGAINGNLTHLPGTVGKKMRSKPFQLEVLGNSHTLSLGDIKSEKFSLTNKHGTISIPSLTVQEGKITSKHFQAKKAMTSKSIQIFSNSISLRSIIMFGKSLGKFHSENIEIESISGASEIRSSNQLKIERYYGGENNINIRCKSIKDKLSIQTGTGKVQFQSQQQAIKDLEKVKLGKMHKGSLKLEKNIITII